MPMSIRHCLAVALLCACAHAALADSRPLTSIATIDLPSYMGTWYEIARYPNRFQRQCTGFDRASYSLKPDGQIQVINRCQLQNGETEITIGTARQLGGPHSAKFEVRFVPAWLAIIPAAWSDYWVIALDQRHQLAAVSEPQRKYLWILSRTPQVEQQAYEALLERLKQKGFDVKRLLVTPQEK